MGPPPHAPPVSRRCGDYPRMDESCPAWDHNIALGVVCAATPAEAEAAAAAELAGLAGDRAQATSTGTVDEPRLGEPGGFVGELARYITPFRRRIGGCTCAVFSICVYCVCLTDTGSVCRWSYCDADRMQVTGSPPPRRSCLTSPRGTARAHFISKVTVTTPQQGSQAASAAVS
jgi:hypothetical protein